MELIYIERKYKAISMELTVLVLIIVALLSIISVIAFKILFYNYVSDFYKDKGEKLSENIEKKIGSESFYFEIEDTANFSDYFLCKEKLEDIRTVTNLNALYTIKESEDGIVYIVSSFNSYKDYYSLGKEIDKEIQKAAESALSGKNYYSEKLINVGDKNVFLYIKPVFDGNDKVIGAVGLEFDGNIINGFNEKIKKYVTPIIVFVVFIMAFIYLTAFKYEMNKLIDKLLYTDNLTNMKNRMAYEKDLEALNCSIKENTDKDPRVGIIMFDLNDLKIVNDTLGHLAGDKYIKDSAMLIEKSFSKLGKTYRIGGDEFVTIIKNNQSEKVNYALLELSKAQEVYNNENDTPFIMSIAVGYEFFHLGTDLNLVSVVKRADEKMYKVKKENKKRFDRSPR